MKQLKGEKAIYYINRYDNTNWFDITQCYQRPSIAKQRAYQNCLIDMLSNKGYDMRVLSRNCNFFTCGYMIDLHDNDKLLIVHTPSNKYYIEL